MSILSTPQGRPPLLLGHLLEPILQLLSPQELANTLRNWADPAGIDSRNLIIQRLNEQMIEASQHDHVTPEMFDFMRVQVVAVCSLLHSMNQHGVDYSKDEHPLLNQPQDDGGEAAHINV